MADIEATIETYDAQDGYQIHYRHWVPEGPVQAQLISLHGIQSHSGWYLDSSAQLCGAGYEVFFLDRRGSGLNQQQRGHVSSFHVLIDDLVVFLGRLRALETRKPVFLQGISWGGKLALAVAKDHPQLMDGLVLVCPGIFPKIEPPWYQKIRIILAQIYWRHRHFTIPLTDPELFTANPERLEFLRTDPQSLHRATAAMLVASRRLDWFLKDVPKKTQLPVLLLQAGLDRIIDNSKTRAFVEQFAGSDKEILMYEGAHHTLEFEPDPSKFIKDLIAWLDKHVSKKTEIRRD